MEAVLRELLERVDPYTPMHRYLDTKIAIANCLEDDKNKWRRHVSDENAWYVCAFHTPFIRWKVIRNMWSNEVTRQSPDPGNPDKDNLVIETARAMVPLRHNKDAPFYTGPVDTRYVRFYAEFFDHKYGRETWHTFSVAGD